MLGRFAAAQCSSNPPPPFHMVTYILSRNTPHTSMPYIAYACSRAFLPSSAAILPERRFVSTDDMAVAAKATQESWGLTDTDFAGLGVESFGSHQALLPVSISNISTPRLNMSDACINLYHLRIVCAKRGWHLLILWRHASGCNLDFQLEPAEGIRAHTLRPKIVMIRSGAVCEPSYSEGDKEIQRCAKAVTCRVTGGRGGGGWRFKSPGCRVLHS